MGYLDYAGLQYLWGKLKEKFAPKSHSHDDRYYTESEMDGKLNSKVNNNEAGANGLINKLSTADGIPNDATVFISQHNDGKTTSYYRRPISTLWTYIKSKADSVYQPKGSYAASSHTHDDRYYTETEINTKLNGKANSSHTHTKSQITDFPTSLKNPTALTIQTNGAIAATYDGSAAKTVNITKSNIGLGNVDNTADANKSVKYATSAGSASTATKATTSGTADKANSVDWSKVQNKPSSYPPSSHSHAYLPLGGGTISGQIKRDVGCSWIYDRDNAIVYGTSSGISTGYHPVIGQKTPSGAWTIGTYSDERLIFDYTTDANKTAGTNNGTQVYLPAQAGTIITSATIGSQSVNYANSAGNATNATNATTATKLSSNAGSNNQPVYFSGGKPVAIGYTIAKSVPADAKFTDTNTWRGIQNNLTSDSTDQSLSAAQGKALKTLVDGKAPASHKHTKSQITDFPTSMPASDVSAWAKAATKPSYTKAEVGLSNVDNTADKDKSVKYATSAGSATTGLNGVSTCIFDLSSNNGSCVRFYNGLQICFGNSSKSNGVVFKLPFANDNYAVVVGGSDTLKNAWYVAGGRTTTGFNPNQSGFAVLFHWIAIGNWK